MFYEIFLAENFGKMRKHNHFSGKIRSPEIDNCCVLWVRVLRCRVSTFLTGDAEFQLCLRKNVSKVETVKLRRIDLPRDFLDYPVSTFLTSTAGTRANGTSAAKSDPAG